MPIWVFIEVLILLTVINAFIGSVSRWTAFALAGLWLVFAGLMGVLSDPDIRAQLTAWLPVLGPFLGAEIGRAVRKRLSKADALEMAIAAKAAAEHENQIQQRKSLQDLFLRLRRPRMTERQIIARLGSKRVAYIAKRVGLTPEQVATRLAAPYNNGTKRPVRPRV